MDFDKFIMKHEKNRRTAIKPAHVVSVAAGTQKRRESHQKVRQSKRFTTHDKNRALCLMPTPEKPPAVESKVEHRRKQLEKWKEEKAKKKKEENSHKLKPFLAGASRYVPPVVKPSISGRVTRSQAQGKAVQNPIPQLFTKKSSNTPTKTSKTTKVVKEEPKSRKNTNSIAPQNAGFKAPVLKAASQYKMQTTTQRKTKINSTFEPVIHTTARMQTRSKNAVTRPKVTEAKPQVQKRQPLTQAKTQSKTQTNLQKSSKIKTKVTNTTVIDISSSDSNSSYDQRNMSDNSQKSPVFVPFSAYPRTPKPQFIPKSESSSEEKLRSPKSPVDLTGTPINTRKSIEILNMTPKQFNDMKISPTITMSRGKDNARKEMKWKLNEGLLEEDSCAMERVAHFRKQLACEIERMTAMCDQWDHISQQNTLPEFVQEHILSAVGQGRLLMSQKLQQFASLVERCAKPEPGTALVTPADLHGFWDMVFMQVENVDIKFKNLEKLRERNWTEEVPVTKMAAKPAPPRVVEAKRAKPAATSRIRDMIAAARKAKKELLTPVKNLPPTTPNKLDVEEKTFEAGFFSVKSPVRTPVAAHTPTLLKAVLSSEAKKAQTASAKRNSSSFAMLRASLMSRNVNCDGVDLLPLTPVSIIKTGATPGRSILKSANKQSNKKSTKVLFTDLNDSPESSETFSGEVRKTIIFDDLNESIENNQDTEKEGNVCGDIVEANKSTDMPIDTEKFIESVKITENSDENIEPTENLSVSKSKHRLVRQMAFADNTLEEITLSPLRTRNQRKSMAINNDVENLVDSPKKTRGRRNKSVAKEDGDINEKPSEIRVRRSTVGGQDSAKTIKTPKSERKPKAKILEDIANTVPAKCTRSRKSVV